MTTVVDAERLGEVAQRCVAAHVAALVGTLQLDEETVAAEGLREPRRCVRVAHGEPVARAAGEADEPVVQLLEQRLVERRRHGLLVSRPGRPRVSLCAAVSSLQRLAYPRGDSTSSVTWAPPASVTSAPVIGRTPNAFAACANSSEP